MPNIALSYGSRSSSDNVLMAVQQSTGAIPNWNWMWDTEILLMNQPGQDLFLTYLSASYGNQVTVLEFDLDQFSDLVNPSTSPLGAFEADSAGVPLNGPYDIEVVAVGSARHLVVAARGEPALTSFRIDLGSGAASGGLAFADSVGDPDTTDVFTPLRDVYDLAQLRVGTQTFVVAQSAVYGEVSTWRIDAAGQMTFADQVGGFGVQNNPVLGARQVAALSIDDRGYVVAGGSYNLTLFQVTNRGVLVQKDAEPLPLTQGNPFPIQAMDVAQVGDRAFVYIARSGELHSYEILRGLPGDPGGAALVPRTVYTGLPATVSMVKAREVDGVDFLLVTDQILANTGGVLVYIVEPDGGLSLFTKIANESGVLGGQQNLPAMYQVQSADIVLHYGLLTVAVTSPYGGNINGWTGYYAIDSNDNDEINGDGAANTLVGLDLGDTLRGGGGDDRLFGGYNDQRAASDPNDQGNRDKLYGGNGRDTLNGGKGGDDMFGGNGQDMLDYSTSNAKVVVNLGSGTAGGGHAEGDTFEGMEDILGSNGNDNLTGDDLKNVLLGGAGRDQIRGMGGDDILMGGNVNLADDHADTIFGGAGNDSIRISGGNDQAYGGTGDDTITDQGWRGSSDSFYGDAGNDVLSGGVGNDYLSGGTGNDTLHGGKNEDTLWGGGGNDVLRGHQNADRFVFFAGFAGNDVIVDMTAEDRVVLVGFAGLDDFADVRARTSDVNGEAVLIPEAGQRIVFTGLVEADLSAGMFEYAI